MPRAKKNEAVQSSEDELAKKRAEREEIKHREELNRAAAQFAVLCGQGEGPFEITLSIRDKKTKRRASIKATVDMGVVHFREDQDRLQVFIPISEFQNVTLQNPERARVEE